MPTNKELIEKVASKMQVLPSVPTLYLDLLNDDRNAAMLLNQIVYWCNIKGGDWFYKTYENWQTELRLSEYQVKNAINKLKAHGVQVDFRKVGKTPKLHYRVDFGQLENSLVNFLHSQEVRQSNNLTVKKLDSEETCTSVEVQETNASEVKETCTSINTKITNPEITQKITSSSSVLITPNTHITTHVQKETDDDDDFNSFGLVNPDLQTPATSKPPFDAKAMRQSMVKPNIQRQVAINSITSLIGGINSILADRANDLIDDYGTEWVIAGCEQAALHGGRTLAYLNSVLDNCRKNKCKPGEKPVKEVAQPITNNNNNRFWADEKKLQEMIAANGGIDDGTVKSNWKPALPRYANERKEYFASLK